MRRFLLSVPLIAAAAFYALPAAGAPDRCRAVKMPDGSSVRMCRDAAGRWVPAESAAAAPIPARAEIVFQGTYEMSVARRQRMPARVNLGRMLQQAMNNPANKIAGAMTLKLHVDGAAATADMSGTGGLETARLSGLVQNGICRLADARNTYVLEGRCDSGAFSGTLRSTPANRMDVSGRFSANAAQLTDLAAQDARRAALRKRCDAGETVACVELDTR